MFAYYKKLLIIYYIVCEFIVISYSIQSVFYRSSVQPVPSHYRNLSGVALEKYSIVVTSAQGRTISNTVISINAFHNASDQRVQSLI